MRAAGKNALGGKFDITDHHLQQAKQYGYGGHQGYGAGYGTHGYVPKTGFGQVFGNGYSSGQLYGGANYARDNYGRDSYGYVGYGSAYGTAPGYGQTYGVRSYPQPQKLPAYNATPVHGGYAPVA